MKKTKLFLLVLFLFFLVSCSNTKIHKPEDTNLEFWITECVDEVDFSSYQQEDGWFGAEAYFGKEYIVEYDDENNSQIIPDIYVKYIVTNYPDYSSKSQYITRIEITDPNIHLYNLSLNDSFDLIVKTMEEQNYIVKQTENEIIACKSNVTIRFSSRMIRINAEVTNKFGIIY